MCNRMAPKVTGANWARHSAPDYALGQVPKDASAPKARKGEGAASLQTPSVQ